MLSAKIDGSSHEWKSRSKFVLTSSNSWIGSRLTAPNTKVPPTLVRVLRPMPERSMSIRAQQGQQSLCFDVRTVKTNGRSGRLITAICRLNRNRWWPSQSGIGDIYYGTSAGGQFPCRGAGRYAALKFSKCGSMNSAPPAVSADGTVVYIADAKGALYALDAETGMERSAPTRPAAAVTVCWSTAARWSSGQNGDSFRKRRRRQ